MIILGIETSCDETALALIETRHNDEIRVINSLVHSQASLHSAFGGVYPALAKREHGKNLIPLLKKLLNEIGNQSKNVVKSTENIDSLVQDLTSQNPDLIKSVLENIEFLKTIPHIDQIAVTEGPGLEPALWVGIIFARILGVLWKIPVIPINHMEGHIIGSLLEDDKPYGTWQKLHKLPFPSIAMLISGGHTELVGIDVVKDSNNEKNDNKNGKVAFSYKIIGETRDDAVGEAFDKVARLLELPYPGGPHVSKLADEAREKNILAPLKLPRPMISTDDCNFSFSGLKTAVLYAVREETKKHSPQQQDEKKPVVLDYNFRAGLAREFEDSITEVLETKLKKALDEGAQSLIVGGGVSANKTLRAMFKRVAKEYGIPLFLPSSHISGDNALMIAVAAVITQASTSEDITIIKPLKADGTKRL